MNIAPNRGSLHGTRATDPLGQSLEAWRLHTHRNVLADKQQQLAAPAERDATQGAGVRSPRSKYCDVRSALVEPVRLDILVELGEALFVGSIRESDGGCDGPCACPTSRPRLLDEQHDLADDRGDRGAGCHNEERDVWNAQIVHPLLVRELLALQEEKQIACYVLQRSKQARIRRGTKQAGL